MAEFIVRLGTPAGEIVTRTVEALAANDARARLEREGFKVFAVTPPKAEGAAFLTRAGGVGGRMRVKANDFLLFNQQLAALLRAGIPILQAITMLRRRAASVRLRVVLEEVEEAIRGGAALFLFFFFKGAASPEIYTASILAGERSGSLREMLDEVATFYEAESEVRLEQLTTTLEPAILVVMGGVVVIILLAIYLPIIQSISNGPMMH